MIYEFRDIPTPDKLDDILEKARTPKGEKELEDRKETDDLVGEIYKIGVLKKEINMVNSPHISRLLSQRQQPDPLMWIRKTKSNRAFYE